MRDHREPVAKIWYNRGPVCQVSRLGYYLQKRQLEQALVTSPILFLLLETPSILQFNMRLVIREDSEEASQYISEYIICKSHPLLLILGPINLLILYT
jgi:hypothetical protein